MVAEVLDALRPTPGGRYADGTIGGAGHAAAILAASAPTGWLWACDRDGTAVEAARARLAMDAGQAQTAADLVNAADAETLAQLFEELGGESRGAGRRLAKALVREREA